MDRYHLLLANGFLSVPASNETMVPASTEILGTVLSNIAYYGFAPSREMLTALRALDAEHLALFWKQSELALMTGTGDDRPMAEFTVYKNFPREVLDMSQAQYWVNQILMYLGLPAEFLAEVPQEREAMTHRPALKVLVLEDSGTLDAIASRLVACTSRWTEAQAEQAMVLIGNNAHAYAFADFSFKENGIAMMAHAFARGDEMSLPTATDVLRLAHVLSGGDAGLRKKVPFRHFTRAERRTLLGLIEACSGLDEDMGMRREPWKRLLALLHPGDHRAFPGVSMAYDTLYRGSHGTYAARVERNLKTASVEALVDLATRPGDFLRRLHKTYALYGRAAIDAFTPLMPMLTTHQLLKLDGYLATISGRNSLIYAPMGNWTKAQFARNKKTAFGEADLDSLRQGISRTVGARLNTRFPQGVTLDPLLSRVRLQTNDQKLATYGRGTVFPIPDDVSFIRTASYWQAQIPGHGSIWFDNGLNFFGADWKEQGTICWNSTGTHEGAVFSGDPVNASELKGRACQMIDLDLDKLQAQGVRYAVWSVLCYSHIAFGEAADVLATLQWGQNAEEGKLYEPSRAQMVFPLKGDGMTKYVAYIDLETRELVYMDAGLYGNVSSANYNGKMLGERMPAFLEYLNSLPTVVDVFSHARQKADGVPVLYSDEKSAVEAGPAYVFQRRNANSDFEPLDMESILKDKG